MALAVFVVGAFIPWTLEEAVADVKAAGAGEWVDEFEDRYLAFERIDAER